MSEPARLQCPAAGELPSAAPCDERQPAGRRTASPPPAGPSPIGRVSLPETVLHWFGWTFGCFYSTYRLYDVIRRHPDALDAHSSPGWVAGLSVDHCDDEFEVLIKGQLATYAVFMTIHLVVGQFLHGMALNKVVPLFHALLAAAYLCFTVGVRRYALLLAVALAMFGSSRLRSRPLSWLLVAVLLLGHQQLMLAVVGPDLTHDAENRTYLATVVQMWNLCRAVMFCCDQADRPPALATHDNVVTFLGFVFYGPTLQGPLLAHTDYLSSLTAGGVAAGPGWPRLRRLLLSLARLGGWLLFLEVSNHVLHYHALIYSPEDMHRLFGRWEIAGLNYWAGQYFHVKYVVCYGIPCALASFEGVPTPLPPRCVSWIASYSDMWKYFDHGLYRFMQRHIYRPLCGAQPSAGRRMAASAAVFAFVFAWHGLLPHILVWSVANFVCVTVERAGGRVASSRRGREWRRVLGASLRRRCQALLLAPLFLVSLVSQAGFLTNSIAVSWLAMGEGLAPASACDMLVTLGFMYCGCQVSYDVKRWRQQRARLQRADSKLKQP
ncbi:Protein-cysteine N-palmitoyltransferase Rasp [Amphibalanus amphitrite]|uniref:Protein-cysteine N-palmitoyltransferase Rasp n=1 Tax=Amphibalanus amphitrite TaxID=1232801 RepID=A0A6A4V7U8_AMPAM|nr:Protein-cysteine N-palmitoyltransferase Rasp [Amphibalanus amphitrite]